MMKILVVPSLLIACFLAVVLCPCQAQDGGVIYGCVIQQSGFIRIVADTSECKKTEKAISWNVQGPAPDIEALVRRLHGNSAASIDFSLAERAV